VAAAAAGMTSITGTFLNEQEIKDACDATAKPTLRSRS
jgi:hypothetical protein